MGKIILVCDLFSSFEIRYFLLLGYFKDLKKGLFVSLGYDLVEDGCS